MDRNNFRFHNSALVKFILQLNLFYLFVLMITISINNGCDKNIVREFNSQSHRCHKELD